MINKSELKQNIYWNNATPEDFENADLHTWIEGVGIISTKFEKDFVRCFGKFLRSHPHTPAAPSERIGSIRTNVFMDEDKVWLIERVNAGMGEHEYVISYLGDHFATVPSEVIAREIVEMQCHTCPVFTPEHDATICNQTLDAYAKWDNTRWTTQRVKEYKESLRTEAPK